MTMSSNVNGSDYNNFNLDMETIYQNKIHKHINCLKIIISYSILKFSNPHHELEFAKSCSEKKKKKS